YVGSFVTAANTPQPGPKQPSVVPLISVIGDADASRAVAMRLAIINAARINEPRCTARLLPRTTTIPSVPRATGGGVITFHRKMWALVVGCAAVSRSMQQRMHRGASVRRGRGFSLAGAKNRRTAVAVRPYLRNRRLTGRCVQCSLTRFHAHSGS